MKSLETLRDLLQEQTMELKSCIQQELKELPTIEKYATSFELKKIINKQIRIAKNQLPRIKSALNKLPPDQNWVHCKITESIFEATKNLMASSKTNYVRDAAIIYSLQQLGHRKIAGLGSAASFAGEIGQINSAQELFECAQEEKRLEEELTALAILDINKKAARPFIASNQVEKLAEK